MPRDPVLLVAAALLLVPALAAMYSARVHPWYPTNDWALIELQVRDVFTSDTPLLGAWSRFNWRHPGPCPSTCWRCPTGLHRPTGACSSPPPSSTSGSSPATPGWRCASRGGGRWWRSAGWPSSSEAWASRGSPTPGTRRRRSSPSPSTSCSASTWRPPGGAGRCRPSPSSPRWWCSRTSASPSRPCSWAPRPWSSGCGGSAARPPATSRPRVPTARMPTARAPRARPPARGGGPAASGGSAGRPASPPRSWRRCAGCPWPSTSSSGRGTSRGSCAGPSATTSKAAWASSRRRR